MPAFNSNYILNYRQQRSATLGNLEIVLYVILAGFLPFDYAQGKLFRCAPLEMMMGCVRVTAWAKANPFGILAFVSPLYEGFRFLFIYPW